MRHATLPSHMLLIEPSPAHAIMSCAELDAAGVEVTLAATAADGMAAAERLFAPGQRPLSAAILIEVRLDPTAAETFDGLALARQLRRRMQRGLLRPVPIFLLSTHTSCALESAAQDAGYLMLQAPLRVGTAQFLSRTVARVATAPLGEPHRAEPTTSRAA